MIPNFHKPFFEDNASSTALPARRVGFTLLELLMVIAVVAILTAVVLPWADMGKYETMVAAAQSVATDLAYARSLAVSNNSNYVIHFDPSQNEYILEHCGPNATLDILPDTVFSSPDDPPKQHIVKLDELPGIGESVKLLGVYQAGGTSEMISEIEFGPLGETTRSGYSIIVLAVDTKLGQHHALILVNPVTGLATIHPNGQDLPSDLTKEQIETVVDDATEASE